MLGNNRLASMLLLSARASFLVCTLDAGHKNRSCAFPAAATQGPGRGCQARRSAAAVESYTLSRFGIAVGAPRGSLSLRRSALFRSSLSIFSRVHEFHSVGIPLLRSVRCACSQQQLLNSCRLSEKTCCKWNPFDVINALNVPLFASRYVLFVQTCVCRRVFPSCFKSGTPFVSFRFIPS